jgi:hypothetical protein
MIKINLLDTKFDKKINKPKGFWNNLWYFFDRDFYEPEVKKSKNKRPMSDKIADPGFKFVCDKIILPLFKYNVFEYIRKQEEKIEKELREEKIFPFYLGISE